MFKQLVEKSLNKLPEKFTDEFLNNSSKKKTTNYRKISWEIPEETIS